MFKSPSIPLPNSPVSLVFPPAGPLPPEEPPNHERLQPQNLRRESSRCRLKPPRSPESRCNPLCHGTLANRTVSQHVLPKTKQHHSPPTLRVSDRLPSPTSSRNLIENAVQSCLLVSKLSPERAARARLLRAKARLAVGLRDSAHQGRVWPRPIYPCSRRSDKSLLAKRPPSNSSTQS